VELLFDKVVVFCCYCVIKKDTAKLRSMFSSIYCANHLERAFLTNEPSVLALISDCTCAVMMLVPYINPTGWCSMLGFSEGGSMLSDPVLVVNFIDKTSSIVILDSWNLSVCWDPIDYAFTSIWFSGVLIHYCGQLPGAPLTTDTPLPIFIGWWPVRRISKFVE
jgi:hypothetical protein